MTKMAIYEKRIAEENITEDYESIAGHDRAAYVGIWTAVYAILSVVIGLFYVMVGLYIILVLNPSGVSTLTWILFGVGSVILLVCHIYFYVRYGRRRVQDRYDRNKAKSDYLEEQYKILNAMYEERS